MFSDAHLDEVKEVLDFCSYLYCPMVSPASTILSLSELPTSGSKEVANILWEQDVITVRTWMLCGDTDRDLAADVACVWGFCRKVDVVQKPTRNAKRTFLALPKLVGTKCEPPLPTCVYVLPNKTALRKSTKHCQ